MKPLRIFMVLAFLALPLFASQAMAQTITCPSDVSYHENGSYSTDPDTWTADAGGGFTVTGVAVTGTPAGVTATVSYTTPPGGQMAEGFVNITVTDHCQTGGLITLELTTDEPNTFTCTFNVTLTNTDPVIGCPVDVSGPWNVPMSSAAYTASDPDGDAVTVTVLSAVPAPPNMPVVVGDHVEWTPTCQDVSLGAIVVTLEVTEDPGNCILTDQCTFTMTATNPATFSCPSNETQNINGTYTTTTSWTAYSGDPGINITSVVVTGGLPPGISAASVSSVVGLGTPNVTGDVDYTVSDHCLGGGAINLLATDDCPTPNTVGCSFDVTLTNTDPVIVCPGDVIGLYGVNMLSGDFTTDDPDGPVTVGITNVVPAPASAPIIVGDHVEWVPTLADVLLGPITIELTVTGDCGVTDVCTFTMTAVEEWTFICDQNPDPVDPPWVAPGDLKVNIMKITILNYTGTGDDWLTRIVVTSECDDDTDVSAVYLYDGSGTTMLGQDLNGFDAGVVAFEWPTADPARELPDQGSAEFLIVFDIATGMPENHLGNDLDVRIDPDQVWAALYGVIGPDAPGCGVGAPGNVIELDPEPPIFTAASINFTSLSTSCAIRCGTDYTLEVHNIVDNNPHPLAADLCDTDPNHPGVEVRVNLERFGEAVDQLMDCDNANPADIFYDYDGSVPVGDIAEGIDIPAMHDFAPDYILTVTATDWLGNSRTAEYTICPYPIDTKWPDLDPDVDITFDWQDFGNDGFISVGDEVTIKIDMSNQPPYGNVWEILHTIFHDDPPCGPFTYEGVRVELGAWPDFHMGKWDPTGTEFAYPINFFDSQADANEVWEFTFTVPEGNLDVDADDPESKILFTLEDNAGYWPGIPCCIDGNIREAESPAFPYPVDNWNPNITAFFYDWAVGGDQGCLNIMEIGDKILITVNLTGNPNDEVTEVTVDLRTLGGSQYEPLYDDGTNGDDVDGDKVWHLEWTIQDPGPDGGDWSPAGTPHELWVTVWDNGGNSIQDKYLSPFVVDTDVPDPVENLTAEAQAGGVIHLEWVDPVLPTDPAYDIMTYHIYCGTGSISDIDYTTPCGNTPGGDLDWDSGPLTDGTVYCFGIRSEDDACNLEENTHVVVCATADATAPTADFLSPATGSCFNSDFTVIAKSNDLDIDEFHFWYRIKGGPDPTWLDGGTASAVDQVGSRDLNLGMVSEVYEVLATAKDVAGNEQAQADAYAAGQYIEVIWDLEAPWVQISQINGDHNPSGVTLNAGVNEICVIAQDNLATTFDVWLQLDDGTNPPPPRYLLEEDVSISLTTEYCFEFSLANWVTTDCDVTVILMDCPGNEGSDALSLPVEDIIPVECRMSQPTHLQAVMQTTGLEVVAEYLGTDVTEVSLVEFFYRETGTGSWQKFYTTVAHVADFFTGYWDNTGLASGAYDLKAHLYDNAVPANVCETPFITVFIDVEGPNIALHVDGLMNVCDIDKICGGDIYLWAEILDPTIDIVDVEFFYKKSSEPDFLYVSMGHGTPANNATIYTLTYDITGWDDETSYDIKAVPTDAATNPGDPSIVTIFKDCTAPEVAFTKFTTPTAEFTNPSTKLGGSGEVYAAKGDTMCMEVSVLSSEDTCGLEKVEYSLFVDPDWKHIGTSTAPDEGFPICFEPLELGLIEGYELDDGHWTGDIKAVLYDSLGNPSEDIITLYILDVEPSQAVIVEPENGSYVWGDVTLQSKALNAYEICEVCYEYKAEEGEWQPVLNGCTTSSGNDWEVVWHTLNTIADGVYYLRAVATDCDNNVDLDPRTIQVTVSNTLPTITMLDPVPVDSNECPDGPIDTLLFIGGTVELYAQVGEDATPPDVPVERVDFYYKSIFGYPDTWTLIGTDFFAPQVYPLLYAVTWDASGVADGAYHLKATVTEAGGRVGDSPYMEVHIDNTPPLTEIIALEYDDFRDETPNNADITQGTVVEVEAIAFDTLSTAGASECYNSGMEYLQFYVRDCSGPGVPLDIVWVVDASGSMWNEQEAIGALISQFAAGLGGVDYQLAVVSFDTLSSILWHPNWPNYHSVPMYPNGNYDTPGTGTGLWTTDGSAFNTMVTSVGLSGGKECGFSALMETNTHYTFRPGASKHFILVTDEDAKDFGLEVAAIDYMINNGITVHLIGDPIGGATPDEPFYSAYENMVNQTGGMIFDIATSHWGALLAALGAGIAGGGQEVCFMKPATEDGHYFGYWNTSGLPIGEYCLFTIATDGVGNQYTSPQVVVRIRDWTPPLVTIAAFHDGYVFGVTADTDIRTVDFKYRPTGGIFTGDERWTTIGLSSLFATGIWKTNWDPTGLTNGTTYEVLAASKDSSGNALPEDSIPRVTIVVVNGVISTANTAYIDSIRFKAFDCNITDAVVKAMTDGTQPTMLTVYNTLEEVVTTELVSMERSTNTSTWFAGTFDATDINSGGTGNFYASLTSDLITYIEMNGIVVAKVFENIGTNGPIYGMDNTVVVSIPDGATHMENGLAILPSDLPLSPSWQNPEYEPIGNDKGEAAFIFMTSGCSYQFINGKRATITISYDETMVTIPEENLRVGWWDGTQWVLAQDMYLPIVNTTNNTITFYASVLHGVYCVLEIGGFVIEGPTVWPICDTYTGAMPVFAAQITDLNSGIDPNSINVWLDSYRGFSNVRIVENNEAADGFLRSYDPVTGVMEVSWASTNSYPLSAGLNAVTVSAKNNVGTYKSATTEITVDATVPDVVWHPVWVSGEKPAVTFIITDDESGVNKDSIWIDIYDADESDQPYEKDLLHTLYSDGVDEFWTDDTTLYVELISPCDGQYIHVVIYDGIYTTGTDDVGLYEWFFREYKHGGVRDCVGNRASPEHLVFPIDRVGPQCNLLTPTYEVPVKIQVTDPVDTVFHHTYKQGSGVDVNSFKITENGVEVTSFTFNSATNILTYTPTVSGPIEVVVTVMDMVGNEGGVEFDNGDEDTEGPVITWTSLTEMPIRIRITDAKSGVDWSTLKFYEDGLLICEGLECTDEAVVIDATRGVIEYNQPAGRIHVEIEVRDNAGNLSDADFYTEEEHLAFMDPHNYPNPFDPRAGNSNTTIDLGLSKSAYVTVKIYDFAGEYVTTIATNQFVSPKENLYWDGTSEDGTDVANGTYLCYIKAKDSNGSTKTAVIKITVLKRDK